jgi:hypothetical protein
MKKVENHEENQGLENEIKYLKRISHEKSKRKLWSGEIMIE